MIALLLAYIIIGLTFSLPMTLEHYVAHTGVRSMFVPTASLLVYTVTCVTATLAWPVCIYYDMKKLRG